MIGNFTYDEILKFAQELKESIDKISALSKANEVDMLESFIANVERYVSFLKNTVDLYKVADETLAYLRELK